MELAQNLRGDEKTNFWDSSTPPPRSRKLRPDEIYHVSRAIRKTRQDRRRNDIPTDKYLICPTSFLRNEKAHGVRLFVRNSVISNCDRCNIDFRFRGPVWEAGNGPAHGLSIAEAAYCVNYLPDYLHYHFTLLGAGQSLGYQTPNSTVDEDLADEAMFLDLYHEEMRPTGKYVICSGSFMLGSRVHGVQIFKGKKQIRAICRGCGIYYHFKGGGWISGTVPSLGMSLEDASCATHFLQPFINQLRGNHG